MAEEPQNQGPPAEQQQQQQQPQSSSSSSSSSVSQTENLNKKTETPFGGVPLINGKVPIMFPGIFPGGFQLQPNQEQVNHGRGLYAIAPFPSMGAATGYPPNSLIPFTYNLPTQSASDTRTGGEGQGQSDRQQQQQQLHPQHPAAQGQVVVRRFQIAFQLDLLLILKLAAVIFLFNQDGSRQRLALLVFSALIVYLYQTGALAPLVRWLSQGMHRAAMPPRHPPRPPARPDNDHAAGRAGNENVAAADAQPGVENQNQPENGDRAGERDRLLEPGAPEGGNRWWGIVKEVQMIVFGFITSLLPGFHNMEQ